MKKILIPLSSVCILSIATQAQARKYPDIYPFKPMKVESIYNDVENISETKDFEKNFIEILKQNLSKANTKRQPWTSSYWPLSKGVIADPYENSTIRYYTDFLKSHTGVWRSSLAKFKYRKENILPNIDQMTEGQLANLAPSEKYDLLLGDKSFDLTNKIMEYMEKYGHNNRYGSLHSIDISKTDTLDKAKMYASWDIFGSIENVLREHNVLSTRLESKMALRLLDEGVYSNAEEALNAVMDEAQEQARNYVIAEPVMKDIAAWEGICNGWSTAAGVIPRPRKAVDFKLENGKNLRFYPEDIKGLVSLYWFNSLIQDTMKKDEEGNRTEGGVISVGLRCNLKSMKRDRYGRYYDYKADPYSGKIEPRCVGVHPAKFHLSLVNVIGKQGRSFVVERKVKSPVDNHPMSGYEMAYFNPNTGYSSRKIEKMIEPITKRDQFYDYRHPNAKYIIGVETKMKYMDYVKPKRQLTNSERDDEIVKKRMIYDLELDADYNIVGGQWRTVYVGKPRRRTSGSALRQRANHNQPDFFWSITKNWKQTGLFSNIDLPTWDGEGQPPVEFKDAASYAHAFEYINSTELLNGQSCVVKNQVTGETQRTWCEMRTNRPQPLVNVINTLVEKSSGMKFEEF